MRGQAVCTLLTLLHDYTRNTSAGLKGSHAGSLSFHGKSALEAHVQPWLCDQVGWSRVRQRKGAVCVELRERPLTWRSKNTT